MKNYFIILEKYFIHPMKSNYFQRFHCESIYNVLERKDNRAKFLKNCFYFGKLTGQLPK